MRWMRNERGLALITVLVITMITTGIGIALVGLMNTDLTHAGVQHAKARSFYVAQAGLEEAKAQVFAASDPLTYTTASAGVTSNFGDGRFTYWVDNGTTVFCGVGLKTLEAEGEVGYLAFTIRSRVAACGIPGAPFLTSIFGVSLVETQGATSHTYVAPVRPSVPGAPPGPEGREVPGGPPGVSRGPAVVKLNPVEGSKKPARSVGPFRETV